MNRIKHGNINKWSAAKSGQVIEFASSKPRHVKFEITANSNIEIWVANDAKMSDAVLVGTSNGKAEIQYTAPATTYVQLKAEKSVDMFVNIPDLDQTKTNSDEPSFTSIEPRVNNSTEFDRMMQFMKHNEMQRNAQLEDERAALRAEVAKIKQAAEVVENVDLSALEEKAAEDAGETTE
tara:strand:+ start:328 stop:864 length:537 start_codon:yes stop_codon:yes gene_type:complete